MTLARVLPLTALLGGSAAAEDQVDLAVAWPEGLRVVEQWSVETTPAEATRVARSGVLRSVWSIEQVAGKTVLVQREPTSVRTTPRGEAVAEAVQAAIASPWAFAVATEVAASEPSVQEADGVEPAAAPAASHDTLALMTGGRIERLRRVFTALDGQALAIGRPVDVPGLDVAGTEQTVTLAEVSCPTMGPGAACVQVTIVRTGGAATPDGDVPDGGRRDRDIWVLQPATLMPQAASLETVVGWSGADGAVRQEVCRHQFTFLPLTPPAPLEP